MTKLEDLIPGVFVKGITPNEVVEVINVKWHGTTAIELIYKDSSGNPRNELLYRSSESDIEIIDRESKWDFSGGGELFRLVSEALRIKLAYLFDPLLAVNTSDIEPLPHQITAVYERLLPRQPLRFLLSDDPGAGKTIMAGLLIKELYLRDDLQR